MHRLFVALRPPPAIRAVLRRVMGGVRAARWQDDEQLHLTLRYIGEVDRRTAEEVALAMVQVRTAPITITLAGVGAFDKRGRVDALWAGVTPHDALAVLHRKVDHALVRLSLAPERRAYLPHVTLGRLPRGVGVALEVDRWRAAHAGLSSAPCTFDHLYLYESHLGAEGARYDVVGCWPLARIAVE
ncbi:MAG: RNA 2',3'-cyclic phosphodiesterase [Sphingomonas sp.]